MLNRLSVQQMMIQNDYTDFNRITRILMTKNSDYRKRRDMILSFIMEYYVASGKAVSSGTLRQEYDLPYSPATIRNVMAELEEMGYITNLHTSSGRVPTQEGFRYYITFLMPRRGEYQEVLAEDTAWYQHQLARARQMDEIMDASSKMISDITHQAGLGFSDDNRDRIFIRGTHYMLEQPEFGDMSVLRDVFTALEEQASSFWTFFDEKIDNDTSVFIGDELSVVKTDSCAMVITPVTVGGVTRAMFGVLGPMRMNYSEVILKLGVMKETVQDICRQRKL